MRISAGIAALTFALPASAEAPLSANKWLDDIGPSILHGPTLTDPPVANSISRPEIEVTTLKPLDAPVGLVPSRVTGLPLDIWIGSEPDKLAELIARSPVHDNAALQTLLYTLLLTEARDPSGANGDGTILLARIDRLLELGATDAAQELAFLAGPDRNRELFSRWFDATLLTGSEDQSCAMVNAKPHLAPDYAARIFCAVRGGDWQTAALTLETANALDLMPKERMTLLDRFLSPEIFDGAPPLPAPRDPDPLAFRLHETIGERLPTSSLPRAFAPADLRDIAGWKSQLEAGERLARIGAIGPNRLLGLYSDRLPAASGGVWDRVEALQRFETALNSRDGGAVADTLPAAWSAMREAQTQVPFAALFADQLGKQPLPADVEGLAWTIRMLSPDYVAAAATPPDDDPMTLFLAALGRGETGSTTAPNRMAGAIADGFAPDATVPDEIIRLMDDGQRGKAILRAIERFKFGADGNLDALTQAIAALRLLGFEDTARRASLQLMLLGNKRT